MALRLRKHTLQRNKKFLVVIVLAACTALGLLGHSSYTNAAGGSLFTDKLTNDNFVSAGGVPGAVDLHLKNINDIAKVVMNRMGAYYPKSEGSSPKGKYIKILQGKEGRVCRVAGYINGDLKVQINVDGDRAEYTIPMQKVCRGSNFYGKTFNFPRNGRLFEHDSGLYEAKINISYSGVNAGRDNGTNDLNYDVQLFGGSSKRKLALKANTLSDEFGLRSAWANNPTATGNQEVRAEVPFGYPCTQTEESVDATHRTVKLYDADTVFGDTYMWITKNGRKLDKNDYVNPLSQPSWRIERWVDSMKAWKLSGSDQSSNVLRIQRDVVKAGVEYRLVVYNDGKNKQPHFYPHQNTLSVSIPHDSIFAIPTCNYKLQPSVDPPANSNGSVNVGAKIPVQGHIDVTDGYDNDKHNWWLTAFVFDGARPSLAGASSSTKTPCNWQVAKSCIPIDNGVNKTFRAKKFDTALYSFNTAGIDAGDWVCFATSVSKPTYDSKPEKIRHSSLKCVRITGNDDGTTVTPNTYSYYPKLTVTTVIKNDQNYPKIDDFFGYKFNRNKYTWKQLEAKYKARPSSIGISEKGDCSTIIDKGGSNLLEGSCTPTASGNNLFPEPGDPEPIVRSSKQKGPDPIGTWTCYTFAYRRNPPPSQQLKAKIRQYVRDYNDANHDSSDPHWSDDYWVELVPVYNSDGTFSHYDHVIHGEQIKFRDVYDPFDKASPYWDPPKFKFTPFKLASCSIAGIDPKIQIRSNDLKVVGDITTFVRTMEVGSARGSYGSSGEYGVLSGGNNFGMASGSGLLHDANSPDQSAWSPLTFTNNNLSSGYGNFNGVPDPNPPTDANADASYGDGTQFGGVTYPAGMKKVLRINGTLKINGDLKYPDTILSRIGEIPRIIIIADNIEIAPGVKRIDPWLVATNSISTCGPPRGEGWDMSSGDALASANLSTGECNNPLIFNGPVYTTNIYLYRTGGSRVQEGDITNESWYNPDKVMHIDPNAYCKNGDEENCDNTREALSAPAEVFNLRPDAFLSSFSGIDIRNPVATTDKITELPPRF